eukprot:Plantae.Rhodophyta-Rhodochaete_pulchella.ctg51030.p2 GENE.Plantae.Rhodophyta-Rhodochaete_pulchella.ctg51030~~Plantae.Rhodophyta-Rhodochaete_pulchella.ctg51030.p2  ORF type:complete len:110 (-),score=8.76 Plantae.Rhodophyta-Rhodochaete_pulchella.ctg51030:147-476(-)
MNGLESFRARFGARTDEGVPRFVAVRSVQKCGMAENLHYLRFAARQSVRHTLRKHCGFFPLLDDPSHAQLDNLLLVQDTVERCQKLDDSVLFLLCSGRSEKCFRYPQTG